MLVVSGRTQTDNHIKLSNLPVLYASGLSGDPLAHNQISSLSQVTAGSGIGGGTSFSSGFVRSEYHMKTNSAEDLLHRLRTRRARAGIVGLGYVGLPLAVELAAGGLTAVG